MYLLSAFPRAEAQTVRSLSTPPKIQTFLDSIAYSPDDFYRSPSRVLRERIGHCFDGAVLAAAALAVQGYPPLLLEMIPTERDVDHVVALFKRNNLWGAISHGNFSGLRFREPIHRTLREIVLSYFEDYYNVHGEKTLRGYRRPLDLRFFTSHRWITDDGEMETIAQRLDWRKTIPLFPAATEDHFRSVDRRSYDAGLFGSDMSCLYRPAPR